MLSGTVGRVLALLLAAAVGSRLQVLSTPTCAKPRDPRAEASLRAERDALSLERDTLRGEVTRMRAESDSLRAERDRLRSDGAEALSQLRMEHGTLQTLLHSTQNKTESCHAERELLQSGLSNLRTECDAVRSEVAR